MRLVKDYGILRLPKNIKTRNSGENMEHFIRSAAVPKKYYPEAWPADKAPMKITLILARRGVLDSLDEVKRAAVEADLVKNSKAQDEWLFNTRSDDGCDGWENLLPGLECEWVEADHFGMMLVPEVSPLRL